MSDLLAKYDELFDLENGIRNQMALWREQMSAINQATETLIGTDNMKGKTADNMRDYFTGVYGTIQAVSERIMTSFVYNCGIYRNDYSKIDNDDHFVISTSELKSINKRLSHEAGEKEFVEQTVSSIVASVSDISSATFGGFGYIGSAHADLDTFLTTLGTQITDLENTHQQQDFVDLEEGINALQSLINDMSGKETIYKLNFDVATFASSEAYRRLGQIYNNLTDNLQNKQEEFNDAEAARAQHIEVLKAEEEARKKQAETAKTVVMGLCIIGGVAATVLTAGAGSPILVATISGAVTGGVMAGVNTAADMYAAGGWDSIKWGEVGKKALFGAIVGGVTGAVSGATSQAFGKLGEAVLGKIPEATAPILKNAAKIGVKATAGGFSKMITGSVSDFSNSIIENRDFRKALQDAGSNLGKNFVSGFAKSAVTTSLDMKFDKFAKTVTDEKMGTTVKSDYSVRQWIGVNAVYGGGSEVLAGMAGRFAGTMVSTEGSFSQKLQKSYEKAVDGSEMVIDATAGSSSRAAQEYINQKPRLQAEKAAYQKAAEENERKLAKREADGREGNIPGIKYTKSGIPDFSDTGLVYTEKGVPAEVEFKMVNGDASGADATKFEHAYAKKLGVDSWEKPDGYTIHHGEITVNADGSITCRAQLVPTKAHDSIKHTGGAAEQRAYNNEMDKIGSVETTQGKRGVESKPYNDKLEEREVFDSNNKGETYSDVAKKDKERIKQSVKSAKYTKNYGGYEHEYNEYDFNLSYSMPY